MIFPKPLPKYITSAKNHFAFPAMKILSLTQIIVFNACPLITLTAIQIARNAQHWLVDVCSAHRLAARCARVDTIWVYLHVSCVHHHSRAVFNVVLLPVA